MSTAAPPADTVDRVECADCATVRPATSPACPCGATAIEPRVEPRWLVYLLRDDRALG